MPISDFITKIDAFNLMAGGGVTETRSAASRTELEVNEYNLIEKNTGKQTAKGQRQDSNEDL